MLSYQLTDIFVGFDTSPVGQDLDTFINDNYYLDNGLSLCKLCEYSSNRTSNVKTHIEAKHVANCDKQIACGICQHICLGRNVYRMHMKTKHNV